MWQDIWLNEGFATYAEWLWIEHRFGPDAYREAVEFRTASVGVERLGPPGAPPASGLFAPTVYVRGALTLDALRTEIGDEAFFTALRRYADEFAYGNATTADFIGIAENVSGTDLDELFAAWLYGEKLPTEGS